MGDQRIGAQQNTFDPTENRSSCSDAKGQAKDCEEGEAGSAEKHPEAEAQILQHIVLVDVANDAEVTALSPLFGTNPGWPASIRHA